jgi:hypothetical protein
MQNNGESQIINLLKAKTTQLEKSVSQYLSTALFSTNTDSSAGPQGLQNLVTTAGTGTVGGIISGTYSWWGNQHRDSFATDGTYATAANLRNGMGAVYNACSQGNDQIDLVLMSQTAFEWYEGVLTPLKQFTDSRTADAGFQNLLYKASVCMWDRDFPNDLGGTSGDEGMYMLNSKYMKLVVHSGRDIIITPFVKPENLTKVLVLFKSPLIKCEYPSRRQSNGTTQWKSGWNYFEYAVQTPAETERGDLETFKFKEATVRTTQNDKWVEWGRNDLTTFN